MSFVQIPTGGLDAEITANLAKLGLTAGFIKSLAASRQKYDVSVLDSKMSAENLSIAARIAVKRFLEKSGVI